MDSQEVTKVNEGEKSESVENSKENVVDKASEPKVVDEVDKKIEETKAAVEEKEEKKEVVEEVEVEVVEEVADDGEENAEEETKTTTTTVVVIKKQDNGNENGKTETATETETTTTTVVVTKKENDDESAKTETKTTTTTVVLNKKEQENINEDESDSKTIQKPESDNKNVEQQKETVTEAAPAETATPKAVVEDAEDSEESEYEEDEEQSEEEETENTEKKTEKIEDVKESSTVPAKDKPEVVAEVNAPNANSDINNQIENIISDIDINIKAQEKITQLKEQELQLIQKQKDLANQIHQQQILAQKLIAENQLKEQELRSHQQIPSRPEFNNRNQYKEEYVPKVSEVYKQQQQDDFYNVKINRYSKTPPRTQWVSSKNCTIERKRGFRPSDRYDEGKKQILLELSNKIWLRNKESSNLSRTVDLRKILTPATDAPQIVPKNRKLYASSAFYSPTLHPTVEDQVELARRISHSLSDISNQRSKGQSMYVNRKKRSVKWVHEASGQDEDDLIETNTVYKENTEDNANQELTKLEKMPLKLIMNPRGQMRDYNSLKESINVETGLLSPDNCAELITALQLHKGRGAELFAKRRRKAENWVVDETNAGTHSPSGIPDYQQYQAKPATSPNILPAYSDAGKHRVQLNLHQDQLIEKYSKPGVQVVKSPWEAALQTGSASSAFVQDTKFGNQTPTPQPIPSPIQFNHDANDYPGSAQIHSRSPTNYGTPTNHIVQEPYKNSYSQPIQTSSNPQRELAYKPSVAQGWGGRNVELPREYYDQEYENFKTDDSSTYFIDTNEYSLQENPTNQALLKRVQKLEQLQHKLTLDLGLELSPTNDFLQNQALINLNDQVQKRLQKLEHFQQRLAQDLVLDINLGQRRVMSSDSLNYRKISTNVIQDDVEPVATKQLTPENNESVNVQELISSFEKQSLKEQEEAKLYKPVQPCEERPCPDNQQLESMLTEKDKLTAEKGLYVPKEISLASYAPPPVQARDQSYAPSYQGQSVDYAKPAAGFGTGTGAGAGSGMPYSGFPVTNSSTGFYSPSQVPKQQLQGPRSYQKVPTSSMQAPPQVNFNPSPLAFEKLSKFQDYDQRNSSVPSQRYLNQGYNNNNSVRNVTPTPFGSGATEFDGRSSYDHPARSPLPTAPQKFGGYRQPTQNLAGSSQSFNNCARGWNNSSANKFSARAPVVSSNSLPYSDF